MYIFLAIIALYICVIIYEGGHLLSAKLNKLNVESFNIGIGFKLFSIKINETVYTLKILPIAGYSKISNDDVDENYRLFSDLSLVSQIIIILSGIALSILISFILIYISNFIFRNNSSSETFSLITNLKSSLNSMISLLKNTYFNFYRVIIREIDLSDYIATIFKTIKYSSALYSNSFLYTFIWFIIYIQINFSALNIIPIPVLDGGKILFLLLETLTNKKIPDGTKSLIELICGILFAIIIYILI